MTAIGAALRPSSTGTTPEQRLDAARAPVRDPLWFLARQLQTGGFFADDAGSPVLLTISHVTAGLSLDGHPVTGAIEADVEAEHPPLGSHVDTATRLRLATELLRRIGDAGVDMAARALLRVKLAADYPLTSAMLDPTLAAIASRLPDPIALHAAWSAAIGPGGDTGALPALSDGTSLAGIDQAARGWVSWVTPRLGTAGSTIKPTHWEPSTLAYSFDVEAHLNPSQMTLTAAEYDGHGLDWFSFDRSPLQARPDPGPVTEVRPMPVTYPGMPERGYWTIENGSVNLDVLAGQDSARQALVSFAHAYANDWFLVPLQVDPGVTVITSLTVTDTFGAVTEVSAAAELDGPSSRFKLWEVDTVTAGVDFGLGARVFLPPRPAPLEGKPVENVLLARDEMANLGWLIELNTTDDDGRLVDRYQRWLTLRGPSDPTFRPGEAAQDYYRLGTTLPDYWYPLEALPQSSDGNWRLGMASLPAGASDVAADGVEGQLVTHAEGTVVNDEEVSRTGTRVSRVDRIVYGPDGYRVWRARRHDPGQGEASSGLRFDVVGPPAPPATP